MTTPLATLAAQGFVRLSGEGLRGLMGEAGREDALRPFFESWSRLEVDAFMADGGRYRRRRIANFSATPGVPGHARGVHRPHYQAVVHNKLNGGVDRWFAPIEDAVASSAPLTALLDLGRSWAEAQVGPQDWFVEVHQFRIEAQANAPGYPTPEGMHHDGVDFILIAMIKRTNLLDGETLVEDDDGNRLAQFTLEQPLDAVFVEDARVLHGVTPIRPADPAQPSCRDVLVISWRRGSPPAA